MINKQIYKFIFFVTQITFISKIK